MTITTVCPYCHQPQSTQSHPGDQFFEPPSTEVTYIQNETRRIDRLVGELLDKRAALLGRLNAIQAPTRVFPPETLSLIFTHACPSDSTLRQSTPIFTLRRIKFQHPQLIFGAVSSHWRQIAHSTPQLWTSANFDIHPEEWDKQAHRLRLFFEKSRALPMTLTLRFPLPTITGLDEKSLVHSTIDHLILDNLPRIQRLHVVEPPPRWHSIPDRLFQLTELSLEHSNPGRSPKLLRLLNSPSLRHLNISYFPSPVNVKYEVRWDALTKLDFLRVPFYTCVEFLLRCPNLIEYSCRYPTTLSPDLLGGEEWSNPPDSIVKDQLRIFRWGPYMHLDNDHILRGIRLPALQILEWNTSGDNVIDDEDTIDGIHIEDIAFLTNLPSTLSTLELSQNATLFDVKPLLELSNIEHLIVKGAFNYPMIDILERLGSNDLGTRCLPGLTKLTIQNHHFNIPSEWRITLAITDMLVRRFYGSSTIQFRVETIGLWLEVSDELNDLMNRGMELEMTETRNKY